MQTVQSIFSKQAGGSAPSGGSTGGSGGGISGTGSGSSQQYDGLAKAGSVVSSLAKFAMSLQQSASLDQQSKDAEMAGRQEYITAQEKANEIDAKYADVAGGQLAVAADSGISLTSGSLTQARYLARQNADAQVTAARRTADINGNLRRAQAKALKAQAGASRIMGAVNFAADIASSFAAGGAGG